MSDHGYSRGRGGKPVPVKPAGRGLTEMENAPRRHPMETYRAWRLAEDSKAVVQERFPLEERWNGQGDAYRHFRWNFAMTQSIGREAAKAYADSHEVDDRQPANEREMDLRNNRLGRAMAVDPRFKSLTPDAAAELASRKGWLHGLQK